MCNFLQKVKFIGLGHVYKFAQMYKLCYNALGSRFYKNMKSPNFHKGKHMEIQERREMANKVTFTTVKRFLDYCDCCQQLGEQQMGKYKTHRSIPLDTWLCEHTIDGHAEKGEVIICADCMLDAQKEGINIIHKGEELNPETSEMQYFRKVKEESDS